MEEDGSVTLPCPILEGIAHHFFCTLLEEMNRAKPWFKHHSLDHLVGLGEKCWTGPSRGKL